MSREVIFYENHFIEFFQKQDGKVKEKIKYVLELIKQVEKVPEKFLKHISGTNGLYEIRIEYQSNIYRIFCCFDKGKLVVLLNGFQKKTQKIPKNDFENPNFLSTNITLYDMGISIELSKTLKTFFIAISYYEINDIIYNQQDKIFTLILNDKKKLLFKYDIKKDDNFGIQKFQTRFYDLIVRT